MSRTGPLEGCLGLAGRSRSGPAFRRAVARDRRGPSRQCPRSRSTSRAVALPRCVRQRQESGHGTGRRLGNRSLRPLDNRRPRSRQPPDNRRPRSRQRSGRSVEGRRSQRPDVHRNRGCPAGGPMTAAPLDEGSRRQHHGPQLRSPGPRSLAETNRAGRDYRPDQPQHHDQRQNLYFPKHRGNQWSRPGCGPRRACRDRRAGRWSHRDLIRSQPCSSSRSRRKKRARPVRHQPNGLALQQPRPFGNAERPWSKVCPATSYSPTQSPTQYHRR